MLKTLSRVTVPGWVQPAAKSLTKSVLLPAHGRATAQSQEPTGPQPTPALTLSLCSISREISEGDVFSLCSP